MGDSVSDLFGTDPMTEPLTYPGRIPDTSGILIGSSFHPLQAAPDTRPECWLMSGTPLSRVLEQQHGASLSARVPVLAVGSNAAPSQLRRKFAARSVRPVIPLTSAEVCHLVPGVSAHVSRPGYIPATPVSVPGARSRLLVLWLDQPQLRILDETEPNYWRRRLPAGACTVRLESGVTLPACFAYVGRHGYLVDPAGQPRRLTDQRTLIQQLLDGSGRLRQRCGDSPDEFVLRAQNARTRDAVRRILALEGNVRGPQQDPLCNQ
jgi:hypothetical protein